jgi:hypothetical protein
MKMMIRRSILIGLGLMLALSAPLAAKRAKPKAKPHPKHAPAHAHRPAPAAVGAFETDLLDWSKVPFSDQSSHGVLLRQPQGLAAWRLRSSFAFGSQAALPHPAKDLFDVRLEWKVEGETGPRFVAAKPELKSYARWAQESAVDGDLRAEMVTVYSATDVVVAACTLTNIGRKPVRVRPILRLNRDLVSGFKAQVEASPRFPAIWMGLDRGAMVGRPLQEWAGVWMSAQTWRIDADPAYSKSRSAEPISLSRGAMVRQDGGLGLSLTWSLPQQIAPKQSLRLPFMLVWGTDKAAVQALGQKEWIASAQPKGKAWKQAQDRWVATRARLPQAADPRWQPLLKRAALALIMDDYAKRAAMNNNLSSADKGQRDAFYGVESSLAALGWAELDMDRAQAALLELASFAAAAPAPVPPYTGEEKLAWEAGGLPLHGIAAWELYHRDPDVNRASRFLAAMGPRLRNECAWWPEARDGDGNGLYAFSREDEKPWLYQRVPEAAPAPELRPLSGTAKDLSATALPSFQSYSVALSSLVAWQMQAASALAGAASQAKESEGLLAQSEKTRAALLAQAWDSTKASYGAGDQGVWPFVLGLDRDGDRARSAAVRLLQDLKATASDQAWAPWQRYYQLRSLASWGYLKESRDLATKMLETMLIKGIFCSLCRDNGKDDGILDAASASVVMALSLERQEQEVFLTEKTGSFEARWLQFRSLDGSFYMKRTRLPEKKATYAKISIETPNNGPILLEKSFIFSAPESMAFQIQSEWPLNVSLAKSPSSLIFKGSKKIELLVPAKTRYLIRILPVEIGPNH